jgi:hypothetical protein
MGCSSASWGVWTVSGQSNAGANKLTQAVGRHLAFLEGRCTVMYPAVPFPHRPLRSPACRLLFHFHHPATIARLGRLSAPGRCLRAVLRSRRRGIADTVPVIVMAPEEYAGNGRRGKGTSTIFFFLSFAPFPCLAPSMPSFVAPWSIGAKRADPEVQRRARIDPQSFAQMAT